MGRRSRWWRRRRGASSRWTTSGRSREADACKTPGAVGALLRREGLYSSHLTTWRAARERGELAGAPKKRGPVRRVADPRDKKLAEQAREINRWQQRAARAEARRCWERR